MRTSTCSSSLGLGGGTCVLRVHGTRKTRDTPAVRAPPAHHAHRVLHESWVERHAAEHSPRSWNGVRSKGLCTKKMAESFPFLLSKFDFPPRNLFAPGGGVG